MSRPKIPATLIHGFNVKDGGASTIQRLAPYLGNSGIPCRNHPYGWVFLARAWGTWWTTKFARRIAATDQARVLIAHSHGCNLAVEAVWRGHPAEMIVMINPALNADADVPSSVKRVLVYHWPRDLATTAAAWLPFHRWGNMGAVGYTGQDERFRSINAQDEDPAGWWVIKRHSRILQKRVHVWGPRIAGDIKTAFRVLDDRS
jgi:hypothetical protein